MRTTDRSTNRLQYSLLGDPAVRLALPTERIEITAINDTPLTDGKTLTIPAGATARITGRIKGDDDQTDQTFNGKITALVRDIREEIVCRLNNTTSDGAETPFVYYDRQNTIFQGSDQITDGTFTFTFAVPKDIKYADLTSLINLYAVNSDMTREAHGTCGSLVFNGSASQGSSQTGPSIYAYLNSETFSNGDDVNTTPYFVALISDEDGINASGSGIGHDLQLVIDNSPMTTYNLNNYFSYDFGSYTKGQVGFSIPALAAGQHKLLFRAWDVLNNSATTELAFQVVNSLEPQLTDIVCSPNPASTATTFRLVHDRTASQMDVRIDLFDTSGRLLWSHSESGVPSSATYTIDWDLTTDGGRRLNTGLYLYRVNISSDGSSYASKAKKLIVLTNR